MSGLRRPQQAAEAAPQPRVFLALLANRGQSLSREFEVAPRPARLALVEPGADQALLLEAAEGDEDGGLRDWPAEALLEREDERDAVGLAPLTEHGEQDVQLE